MLLIFPSIEISRECCLEVVQGVPGSERIYSIDPVKMAILWRGENAKTLHIVDRDGLGEGKVVNKDIIRKLVQAVDIPVQVGGGLRSREEIKSVLDLGVYRVIVGTAAIENPGLVESLIREFGTRKIAINVEVCDGKVVAQRGRQLTDVTPLEHALQMKRIGVSRIVYAEFLSDGTYAPLPYESLRELALKTDIRCTAGSGVTSYKDLLRLQELEKFGVDSVIIGKPLYENKFPCQSLWRLNEIELTDLGPTRRM
ncbi:MAG: 1-(5-phosphoribosyl)-5-[(5-phosphoribosylamino)methylideneamino] imidazole-4-carboxamide isomerase [Ignavibacteriales bacterium]|nr:1-(5-phosphoribosyl)-5-[(5-phosphoribosylamino)methylideneamino] imidazole-4-carboxamide isomerase [Ignavibacteriales bacterium]